MSGEPLDAEAIERSVITARYRENTPRSAALMARGRQSMPAGSTRTFGYYEPYPVVFERGEGVHLWDVDGRRYIDLTYNGLSLIHGHAYPPVQRALKETMAKGTAWPGASIEQIRFAEALCERIPTAERVRFTNTGTEATMLAVKVARHVTERPLVLKSHGAYHGSYDDLEAGLYGIGELRGRTVLGRFGDLESFERALAEHGEQIAAVIVEPILFTFRVVPPPPGFLPRLAEIARRSGALVILDDCLMFRLAEAGSAQKYGLEPDITCLGKFIGGGLPVGVVAGREEVMSIFDPAHPRTMYHGGSFNGNPLGCAAGLVSLQDLTQERIDQMDAQTTRLADGLQAAATAAGLTLDISGDGSILGVQVVGGGDDQRDDLLSRKFQLAALNHGVFFGQDGEMALATPFTDEVVDEVIERLSTALTDVTTDRERKGVPV